MRWLKKNNPETEEESTPAPARNPDNVFLFRLLAVGYILYIVGKTISLYLKGGEDAPQLWMLCLSTVLLGGGAIFLGVISYQAWKKAKAQQLEEAEAAAEEAFAAEQAEQEEELDMAAVEEEMVQAVERWKAAKKQQDAEENEEC